MLSFDVPTSPWPSCYSLGSPCHVQRRYVWFIFEYGRVGYQIICIYFNHSSGKQIGFIKFTRLRASIFFQLLRREEGGLILPWTCALPLRVSVFPIFIWLQSCGISKISNRPRKTNGQHFRLVEITFNFHVKSCSVLTGCCKWLRSWGIFSCLQTDKLKSSHRSIIFRVRGQLGRGWEEPQTHKVHK